MLAPTAIPAFAPVERPSVSELSEEEEEEVGVDVEEDSVVAKVEEIVSVASVVGVVKSWVYVSEVKSLISRASICIEMHLLPRPAKKRGRYEWGGAVQRCCSAPGAQGIGTWRNNRCSRDPGSEAHSRPS